MKPFVKLLSLTTALFLLIGCLPVLSASAEVETEGTIESQEKASLFVRFVKDDGTSVETVDSGANVKAQVVLSGVSSVQAASLYLSATGATFGDDVIFNDAFPTKGSYLNTDDGVLAVALYDESGVDITDETGECVLCSVSITVGSAPVTVSLQKTVDEVSTGVSDSDGKSLPLDTFKEATLNINGAPGFYGADLVLSESIGINFYVEKTVLDQAGAASSYVTIEFDRNRDGTEETITLYPDDVTQNIDGILCQRYFFDGIAPDNMGQTITAQLFYVDADGAKYSGLFKEYSVTEYITNTYNDHKEDEKLTKLLADLLAYGIASEDYTAKYQDIYYQTIDRDDSTLTYLLGQASNKEVANTANSNHKALSYENGLTASTAAVRWSTVGLNLRDNAALLYVFQPAANKSISDYKLILKVEGRADTIVDGSKISYENQYHAYVYRFRELGPCDMSKVVTACFVDKNDNTTVVSGTLQYSIESYAYYCYKNKTSNPELCALTQALIRYGNSVQSYVS